MIITTSVNQLFQILKLKMGEKEAEALVTFVDNKIKENNEANLKVLATREDIANLRTELKVEIRESKSELLKWIVALFIPLYLSILGLFIALSKLH